jgi:hypothetical protein
MMRSMSSNARIAVMFFLTTEELHCKHVRNAKALSIAEGDDR